jgi:hypothetical protein
MDKVVAVKEETPTEKSGTLTRYAITIAACILGLIHIARPGWAIDSVTLVLLVIAFSPWVASIVQKIKLGDFEIEYRVQKLAEKTERLAVGLTQQQTQTESLNNQVQQVVVQEEFRTKLTAKLQKLLFLANRYRVSLETYFPKFLLIQQLKSAAMNHYPTEARKIDQAVPDTTIQDLQETYNLGLSESQKTEKAVQEILSLISDLRVTEPMTKEIDARVSEHIRIIENAIPKAEHMNSVANELVQKLEKFPKLGSA